MTPHEARLELISLNPSLTYGVGVNYWYYHYSYCDPSTREHYSITVHRGDKECDLFSGETMEEAFSKAKAYVESLFTHLN